MLLCFSVAIQIPATACASCAEDRCQMTTGAAADPGIPDEKGRSTEGELSSKPGRLRRADRAAREAGVYVIHPIEYVDLSPPVRTSLFEDPPRLAQLYELTIRSIRERTREDEERIVRSLRGDGEAGS